MAKDLSKIRTIVIVMMENRSFDHMLGYLALPEYQQHPNFAQIDGLQNARAFYTHDAHPPRRLQGLSLDPDPPHEREDIARQINDPLKGPMRGFVDSYSPAFEKYRAKSPNPRLIGVMEYCTATEVYVTDFLARSFAICDHWFAPLPASTLPNRLMAMSGYALNDHTPDGVMQEIKNTMLFLEHRPDLVYDWLESKGHSWRIYSSGMPFFLQVASMFARYESGNGQFREIEKLGEDALNDDLPDVAFVEPFYWCDPRKEGTAASDDHAPASLAGGQRFLNIVRDAIVGPETIARNKDLWDRLLMIVTYDEHGSFFDHVPPPKVPTKPEPPASYPQFDTLGLRVPAIVISPFVKSGYVHKGVLDHTSILKFLGEKFGDGHYSDLVDNRGVGSLSDVLDSDLLASSADIPDPPQP